MALPATDGFAGTGSLSASWTNVIGTLQRSSGEVVGTGNNGSGSEVAFWNADAFNNDQYGQVVVRQGYAGPCVRMAAGGNGYVVAATSGDAGIYRADGGAYTLLTSTGAAGDPVGKTLKLTATGTALELFFDGVSKLSTTSGTYGSGAAGMLALIGTNGRLDDFQSDNIGGGGGGGDTSARLIGGDLLQAGLISGKLIH